MNTDDYQREFGARLKLIRKRQALTQEQFAEKIGYSQPTITRIESGKRMADAYLVKRVAEEFRCDVAWLLTGKGDP